MGITVAVTTINNGPSLAQIERISDFARQLYSSSPPELCGFGELTLLHTDPAKDLIRTPGSGSGRPFGHFAGENVPIQSVPEMKKHSMDACAILLESGHATNGPYLKLSPYAYTFVVQTLFRARPGVVFTVARDGDARAYRSYVELRKVLLAGENLVTLDLEWKRTTAATA